MISDQSIYEPIKIMITNPYRHHEETDAEKFKRKQRMKAIEQHKKKLAKEKLAFDKARKKRK